MEITTVTLGFVGLTAAAVTAIVLAWPRLRDAMNRVVNRSAAPTRPNSRRSSAWFGSDPVLFVGGDAVSADCGAASDGGGGSCA